MERGGLIDAGHGGREVERGGLIDASLGGK